MMLLVYALMTHAQVLAEAPVGLAVKDTVARVQQEGIVTGGIHIAGAAVSGKRHQSLQQQHILQVCR